MEREQGELRYLWDKEGLGDSPEKLTDWKKLMKACKGKNIARPLRHRAGVSLPFAA